MKNNKLIQDLLAKAFLVVFAIFSLQLSAQTTPVSVFNYPGLNGSGSGCSTENANLIGIVRAIPAYTVDGSITSFSNSGTLAAQLDASVFFFMTDMETQNPSNTTFLPLASRDVIKNWVNAGGVIVMTGTYGVNDTNFLNLIFSWDLGTTTGSSWAKNTVNTSGTPFEGGPSSLPNLSATDAISRGTVRDFTTMWGTDSNATVAVIKYGAGSVIFMGYDFFSAGPSCSQYSSTWVQNIIPSALNYAKQLSSTVDNITYTTADVKYSFAQSGSTYYLLVPSGSTAPMNAQIEAGANYSGVSVITSGNSATTANVEHVFSLAGLVYNTSYDFYTVTKYNLGSGDVFSEVKRVNFSTLDNDLPVGSPIFNQPLLCKDTSISPVSLTIADVYPVDNTYTVTGTSSNISLVSNNNIVITGTGSSRSISVTPNTGVIGTSTISIKIQDSLLKESIVTFTVSFGDITKPTIATLSSLNVNADIGVCTYASSQLTVPTAADNCSVMMVVASPASLVSGANTITWTVTDGAGLTATSTQIVTVLDTQNPTIATLSAMNVNTDAGVCTYISSQLTSPTAADNCSVVSVVASPASLVSGANTVTWTVTDGAGLTATSTQIVTVLDTQNPTIATLSAINVNADAGVCTYTSLQLTAPAAVENCTLVSVVASPASLVSGTNIVTWTVTDGSGLTATSTQTVTVVDNEAPIVLIKNISVQLNATGNISITPAQINNGSSDACGIASLILDKTSFTCVNIGANTVTLTATDISGNVSSQTAIVTVEDKIAPVVFTKNITVQLDASSNILIAAADVNNGSTDNCGIRSLELDKALFSCADIGENVVTLKVTDNSGNVATRAAIVTIVNSQPNLIRKHFDNVIFFDNSSKAFVAFSWYKNGVLVSSQTAQYFKDSGVLNGTYYAKATKIDGTVVTTCPLTFSASIVDEYLKIAPNPVKSNASYQILTNVDSAKLQNARITVFNILGVLVNDKMVDGKTTDMIAPNTDGIYVVRMTLANGKYFTKNLLVKN